MTTFIQHAACKGHRPASVTAHRHQARPVLVARLLRDRRTPRFLIAPVGFGKSALAYEYAEVVFSFKHVFWISCMSPCFLRDLDAGVLLTALQQADADCALVVFEDMPLLSEDRAEAFSHLIDGLLEGECEVVVTTTPARDSLERLQHDRLVLDGFDLLLDDEEAARDHRGEDTGDRAPFSPEARIAGLRWAEDGMHSVLRGIEQEDLPADMMLALWLLLVLCHGSVNDLAQVLGGRRAAEAWEFLGSRYPFLGTDGADGSFRAIAVEPGELASVFRRRMGMLARAAGCQGPDELVEQVADCLLERGDASQTGRLMAAFASRLMISSWLEHHGWKLLWGRAPVELCMLYETVAHGKVAGRSAVNAMMAWASGQVGDSRRALDYARKALGALEADDWLWAVALLAARDQGNASVVARTEGLLRTWLEEDAGCIEDAAPDSRESHDAPRWLRGLVKMTLAPDDLAVRLRQWERTRMAMEQQRPCTPGDLEPWLLAAAAALEAFRPDSSGSPFPVDSLEADGALEALIAFCCEAVEDRVGRGMTLGMGSMQVADHLQRLDRELTRRKSPTLSAASLTALRVAQVESAHALEEYRGLRQRRNPVTTLRHVAQIRDRPQTLARAAWRDGASTTLGTPLLQVRLFGTMSVRIGAREVPPHLFNRRKVRLLLALLVVHRGRDITRDALSSMMWPELPRASRAKNFYKIWHGLESALSGDESCPYLVRDRYGCRLDSALFVSDMMEFEELTRHLLFGDAPSSVSWEMLYQMVKGPFSGELLPIEQDNDAICRLRDRCNVELVDGLIAAARRLCRNDECQGALWFAREALARDATREDAYAALMEAQMRSGQRTAALNTFFTCRTYLADTLGLDPSPQLLTLYQRLLDEDSELAELSKKGQ